MEASLDQLIKAAEVFPTAVIITDPDGKIVLVNGQTQAIFGYREDELAGQMVEVLIPERYRTDHAQHRFDYHLAPRSRRMGLGLDLVGLRKNGEEFPIEVGLSPAQTDSGMVIVAMVHDITVHKRVEETLSAMNQRLIEAQEEERAWIARELHDDIVQRITLLTMNLSRLPTDDQTALSELRKGVLEAIQYASNPVTDIQALSHRLHSSKLEYVGLAKAAAIYCRELCDQHGVEIDLHAEDVPVDLSGEIALCLFRVLQEALRNAIRHSGSRRFQVSLSRDASEIVLTVRDSGIGFDPAKTLQERGLGLISMKERLKLVQGQLSIESGHMTGTTVCARVPLVPKARPAPSTG